MGGGRLGAQVSMTARECTCTYKEWGWIGCVNIRQGAQVAWLFGAGSGAVDWLEGSGAVG